MGRASLAPSFNREHTMAKKKKMAKKRTTKKKTTKKKRTKKKVLKPLVFGTEPPLGTLPAREDERPEYSP